MNRSIILIVALFALLLAGCGRKEPPQIVSADNLPVMEKFNHELAVNALRLTMTLQGGGEYGVGYQIDRAELDPFCKCPSLWRRMLEEAPRQSNADKPLVRIIHVVADGKTWLYRVRAIDGLGRLGPWSETIEAFVVVP